MIKVLKKYVQVISTSKKKNIWDSGVRIVWTNVVSNFFHCYAIRCNSITSFADKLSAPGTMFPWNNGVTQYF